MENAAKHVPLTFAPKKQRPSSLPIPVDASARRRLVFDHLNAVAGGPEEHRNWEWSPEGEKRGLKRTADGHVKRRGSSSRSSVTEEEQQQPPYPFNSETAPEPWPKVPSLPPQ